MLKNGKIDSVELLDNLTGGCGENAVELISGLPRWKAARRNNVPVDMHYQVEVEFSLKDKDPSVEVKDLELYDYKRWHQKQPDEANLNRLGMATNRYVCKFATLGWINIDRFLGRGFSRKGRIISEMAKNCVEIFCFVKNRRAVFTSSMCKDNYNLDKGLFSNLEVFLLGIGYKDNEIFYATNEIKPGREDVDVVLDFRKTTLEELEKQLAQLEYYTSPILTD